MAGWHVNGAARGNGGDLREASTRDAADNAGPQLEFPPYVSRRASSGFQVALNARLGVGVVVDVVDVEGMGYILADRDAQRARSLTSWTPKSRVDLSQLMPSFLLCRVRAGSPAFAGVWKWKARHNRTPSGSAADLVSWVSAKACGTTSRLPRWPRGRSRTYATNVSARTMRSRAPRHRRRSARTTGLSADRRSPGAAGIMPSN